jgi:carbonic anhydrase
MKKLVNGIVDFRQHGLPEYREKFAHLALGQSPDTLFIACSDSRVVPNVFASTDPGDLFVVRNVGNLVPPCQHNGICLDKSEAAAIEFAINTLKVSDIVICGHSDCGAMSTILNGRTAIHSDNLRDWLSYGDEALQQLKKEPQFAKQYSETNRLSQRNVLIQMEHLKTYPVIQEKLKAGKLKIHGWWFELGHADVFAYEESVHSFVLIDEEEAARIIERLHPTEAKR